MREIFTAKAKLSDIVLRNRHLVPLLQRFNIALGFGEKTVEEVCALHRVDPDLFLLICQVYSFDDYVPTEKEIIRLKMTDLIDYLVASHATYLSDRLPHIAKHLHRIAEACLPEHKAILLRFFNDYKAEVEKHFLYEETTVFPYIHSLKEGKRHTDFNIHQFETHHSNIEDKLDDLWNIMVKYLPGEIMPQERISIMQDIVLLSMDLCKHSLIEDRILVPYVAWMERELGDE